MIHWVHYNNSKLATHNPQVTMHNIVSQVSSFIITNENKASGIYFMKMEIEKENIFVKLIVK